MNKRRKEILLKNVFVALVSLTLLMGTAGIARAVSVTFGDTSTYWSGWQSPDSADNSKDTIGIPDFTGGSAEINSDSALQKLTFNYEADYSYQLQWWYVLTPGDLFIDVDADNEWDYLIDLNGSKNGGNYNLYSVSIPLDSGSYVMSGRDNTGNWRGWEIRDNHPIGYTPSDDPVGSVYFSGWITPGDTNPVSSYFDFGSNSSLFLGNEFTIGWMVNCANDVVYETMNNPFTNPVPEPSTILLISAGLAGLAIYGRWIKNIF
ncbi:MAG: PEP-CTERM sorting domain-containing protein [Nitrospirota bacterium]